MNLNEHFPVPFRQGSANWGGFTHTNSFADIVAGYNDRVGSSVPYYRDRLSKHSDASSAYTRNTIEYNVPFMYSSSYDLTLKKYDYHLFRQRLGCTVPTVIPHDASLKDLALKRIKSKLATAQNEYKALVPLGEIRETRDLIHTTALATEGLLKSLLDLKRHGNVKGVIRAASDAWLQYSFAISPTVSEVKNLLSSIDSHLNKVGGHTMNIKGGSQKEWFSSSTFTGVAGARGLVWRPYGAAQTFHKLSYSYKAGVNLDISSGNDYGAKGHFGLLARDIIPAVWELVPLSFVGDYFTTTGDFLADAFQSPSGNCFYANLSTIYTVQTVSQLKCQSSNPSLYRQEEGTYTTQTGMNRMYERVILGSTLPHRAFRIKSVDEVAANSVKRVLNLASLLGSRIGPGAIRTVYRKKKK